MVRRTGFGGIVKAGLRISIFFGWKFLCCVFSIIRAIETQLLYRPYRNPL